MIKDKQMDYQINLIENVESEKYFNQVIQLDTNVNVKPNSKNTVEIKVDCDDKNKCLMFEPKSISIRNVQQGILWANGVSTVKDDGNFVLSIMNTTDREITLKKGEVIGVVQEAEVVEEEIEVKTVKQPDDQKEVQID